MENCIAAANLKGFLDDLLLLRLVVILVKLVQPWFSVIIEDQDRFYHSHSEIKFD